MATISTNRQKKLARLIVENSTLDKPLNKKAMLEKVGYTTNVAEVKANDILNSRGVKIELEVLGFNENAAKEVVASILHNEENEPRDRLKASDMIFKVHGSYAPEKHQNMNINIEMTKEVSDLTKKLNDVYRHK